jgi:hypothetical protein
MYLNSYLCNLTALLIALLQMQMPHTLALKYQWSIAFEALTSYTDGPFKLISIKSFKLCAITDDLKLFLITFILLNPCSQTTVDARITETVDINFPNRGYLSLG